MKRTIFYATNAIICTIFLSVRLAYSIFLGSVSYLTDKSELLLNTFTLVLIVFLIFSIYQGYRAISKTNELTIVFILNRLHL